MSKESQSPSNSPFWVDAQSSPAGIAINWQEKSNQTAIVSIIFLVAIIVITVFSLRFFSNSSYLIFCTTIYFLLVFSLGVGIPFYLRKRQIAHNTRAFEIQERAMQKAKASTMGSAIHVAGHPSLDRNQPVILALGEDNIQIYAYDNSSPLVSLPLADIIAVKTVVYDDERVPHAETIDSNAQALQLDFEWRKQPFTMLFNTMKQIRPIDWYHAIQQVKLNLKAIALPK